MTPYETAGWYGAKTKLLGYNFPQFSTPFGRVNIG
jgi:hypothetical protein